MTASLARFASVLSPVLLVAALGACGATVVETDGAPESGDGGTSDDTGDDEISPTPPGPAEPAGANAIAMMAAELQALGNDAVAHDDWLYFVLGDPTPSCQNPATPSTCPQTSWQVVLGMEPSLVAPGAFDLASDTWVDQWYSVATECTQEGDALSQGTLTIQSVTADAITFTLAGTPLLDFINVSVDGTYVAARCP